ILLVIAAMNQKKLRQIDVANAFLYALVDAEIFVELPHGSNAGPNQICQLEKSLVGSGHSSPIEPADGTPMPDSVCCSPPWQPRQLQPTTLQQLLPFPPRLPLPSALQPLLHSDLHLLLPSVLQLLLPSPLQLLLPSALQLLLPSALQQLLPSAAYARFLRLLASSLSYRCLSVTAPCAGDSTAGSLPRKESPSASGSIPSADKASSASPSRKRNSSSNSSSSSGSAGAMDRERFLGVFQQLKAELLGEDKLFSCTPDSKTWMEKNIDHNVPGGMLLPRRHAHLASEVTYLWHTLINAL
ncbi:unnamed protein product, partial [Closterium sp. NIES-54]